MKYQYKRRIKNPKQNLFSITKIGLIIYSNDKKIVKKIVSHCGSNNSHGLFVKLQFCTKFGEDRGSISTGSLDSSLSRVFIIRLF